METNAATTRTLTRPHAVTRGRPQSLRPRSQSTGGRIKYRTVVGYHRNTASVQFRRPLSIRGSS